MLGICSWTAPWEVSPLREKGYIGDIEMESKVFAPSCSIEMTRMTSTRPDLRAFILNAFTQIRQQTAYVRIMISIRNGFSGSQGQKHRSGHDHAWNAPTSKNFDLFYGLALDFDVKTGAPTEKGSLKNSGLDFALSTMKQEGL